MAAPTFIQEAETAWDTGTTPKGSGNFTTQTGDVVVACGVAEGNFGSTALTATGTNVTTTKQQEVAVNAYCTVDIAAGVVGAGGTTSVSWAETEVGDSFWFGGNALTFRGSDGIGASAKTNTTGAPSLSITTTQANSAIVVVVGDWNAVDGASRTWRTVNSITPTAGNGYELTYFRDSSHYTVYIAYYPDAGAAGSKTVGLSAPSGQKYSIVAFEVKGTASSGINGSASITLDGVTTTAASAVALKGTSSTTLANITTTATGRLPLAGAASITLAAATLTATGGATPNNGAASLTLDAVTISGVSETDIAGSASITLASATTTAAGVLPLAGAASITLASATTTATGALANSGAASLTLAAVTTTAEGVLAQQGTGQATLTLADITVAVAGALPITGAAAQTLDGITASAQGGVAIAGAASLALDDLNLTAELLPVRTGEASVTLDGIGVAAAGQAGSVELVVGPALTVRSRAKRKLPKAVRQAELPPADALPWVIRPGGIPSEESVGKPRIRLRLRSNRAGASAVAVGTPQLVLCITKERLFMQQLAILNSPSLYGDKAWP